MLFGLHSSLRLIIMIYRGRTASMRWEVCGMRSACMNHDGEGSSGEVRTYYGRRLKVSCIQRCNSSCL
jgi:hypothetical protein